MSPWRYRCPKNHNTLEQRKQGYYCKACQTRYEGDPYDAKHTDFPVEHDDGLEDGPHRRTVLAELVRICEGPMRAAVKSREIDCGSTAQVRHALVELEERGLVDRRDQQPRAWWRPTAKGRRAIQGHNDGDQFEGVADD